jgi:hypothetical protein
MGRRLLPLLVRRGETDRRVHRRRHGVCTGGLLGAATDTSQWSVRPVIGPRKGRALLLGLAALAGCAQDVSVNAPGHPPPGDTTGTDTTTVQRASLTLTVTVRPADSALAAAIGSPGGVLQNALVSLWRGTSQPLFDTTDTAGSAAFADLLPGAYTVAAARLLTPEETAGFDSTDQDVNAFGGGGTITVQAPSSTARVNAAAGRRGSLVISENFAAEPYAPDGVFYYYYFGHYVELYNNSDTAIQLAGKVIGRGISWFRDYPNGLNCAEGEQWRDDPDGIWARFFDAFPSKLLAPGATVVVATDAIDHSVIVPGMPNLTHADFEFHGSNDVDNPAVPNMILSGVAESDLPVLGHGLRTPGDGALFVAESLTVSALPHDNLPVQDPEYVRVPREKVLDVFTTSKTPTLEAETTIQFGPLCAQILHDNFDHGYASLYDGRSLTSMKRRVAARLPDGRVVLLRTRTSRNDFETGAQSLGRVP